MSQKACVIDLSSELEGVPKSSALTIYGKS